MADLAIRQNNWANGFVFKDRLVLGVSGSAKGAQIWTSDDGLSFQPAVADGLGDSGNTGVSIVQEQPVLDGKLYIGTSNPASGGEIWRTGDGLKWERVADDGLERSSNTSLTPFVVFNGQLYAVGISSGGLDKLKGLEIYRSADGSGWQKVVSDGFSQGKERNVSGALQVFKDRLYLTADTMDPRLLMPGASGRADGAARVPVMGFRRRGKLAANRQGRLWPRLDPLRQHERDWRHRLSQRVRLPQGQPIAALGRW